MLGINTPALDATADQPEQNEANGKRMEGKMAGQMNAIYNGYVASTTRNNVEPVTIKGGREVFEILRREIADFDFSKPHSHMTRFWDNDSRTKVFEFDDGRIAEYATTNTAMGTALLAVFETHDDWFTYRKPMGRFHYFNT